MAWPIIAGGARAESVHELPVNSLHHTVGLRVEGGGVVVSDAEAIGELGPQLGRELGPSVGGEVVRSAKSGDPAADQSVGAGRCRCGSKRNCLQPASGTVYDCEDMSETFTGGWQGAYQINMDMLKMAAGHGDGEGRGGELGGDLAVLAMLAVFAPFGYVGCHFRPHPARCDEAAACSHSWMSQ